MVQRNRVETRENEDQGLVGLCTSLATNNDILEICIFSLVSYFFINTFTL